MEKCIGLVHNNRYETTGFLAPVAMNNDFSNREWFLVFFSWHVRGLISIARFGAYGLFAFAGIFLSIFVKYGTSLK